MKKSIVTYWDIYIAYRRLKSYYYYDNSNLLIRKQIADFEKCLYQSNEDAESLIKNIFSPIAETLNSLWSTFFVNGDISSMTISTSFRQLLDEIKCYAIPKDISKEESKDKCQFITNKIPNISVQIERCNYMIEAPILIHLISVLWIQKVGVKLQPCIGKCNYANKLNVDKDDSENDSSVKDGLALFRPYFIGYQEWRDNALGEVKRLLDKKNDATILSLDVKRYYYSVRLNVPQLVESYFAKMQDVVASEEDKFLNCLLQTIHEQYQLNIEKYLDDKSSKENKENHETVLPVGLLSSGILANLYLVPFDECIVQKVSPVYYGRYVDDMIFVFQNRQVDEEAHNPIDKFIEEYFCKEGTLEKSDDSGEEGVVYKISDYGIPGHKTQCNLRIQSKKVVLEHFDHQCSYAAIDLFMHNLAKNRSEYRFLPEEENITAEFDHEAYQLLYCDSVNKIRSIKDFKENKFGAAKYLAKQIYLSKLGDLHPTESSIKLKAKVARQLLTFFTGATAITMFGLWEKVATYFILNADVKSLITFYHQIKEVIKTVELKDGQRGELTVVKTCLEEHLLLSLAMPMALAPQKYEKLLKGKVSKLSNIVEYSRVLRCSNMFRGNNTGLMGINLTDDLLDNSVDLHSDNLSHFSKLHLNDIICRFSSRFIHFEELNLLAYYEAIKKLKDDHPFQNQKYEEIEHNYVKYGRNWARLSETGKAEDITKTDSLITVGESYVSLHDDDTAKSYPVDKKIAIANKKVDENHFMNVVKYQQPMKTLIRRQELVKIINDAIEQGCHMLVMSEMAVPFGWLSFLVEQAKHSDIAIITGLEYCVSSDEDTTRRIANFVATILPIQEKFIRSCLVDLREKNFYSPKEELMLEGYRYKFPKRTTSPQYTLFHWRRSYFSVFNCFELADIQSRAKFKSKVDFIIAVEYNRDIHYFSDVTGSWSRDIHCFIVQVNSSVFGDSKVIMPSKTEEKTLVQVKGGDNTVVLVCTLPIKSLRDFQLATYIVQQNDKRFKFTPPSFDHDIALKRFNDEELV